MSIITCTRKIEFDAAHRVMGYHGKCRMLHGHRYKIEATFAAEALSALGMVIDFASIKDVLNGWLLEHWDHNIILNSEDNELGGRISDLTGQKVYYLDYNPTAENMAHYLINYVCPKLFEKHNVKCIKVKLYETTNCYSEAYLSKQCY